MEISYLDRKDVSSEMDKKTSYDYHVHLILET